MYLNLLILKSNNELSNLSFFFDKNNIKSKDSDFGEDEKFEYNCYVFNNKKLFYFNLDNHTDAKNLIIDKLSTIILNDIKSQNKFVLINILNSKSTTTYTYGNPEIVNGLLNKYDFKD